MRRLAPGLLAVAALVSGSALSARADDDNMMAPGAMGGGMMGPPVATAAPVATESRSIATLESGTAAAPIPELTQDLDRLFAAAWKKAGVTVAPDAPAGELLRRVMLDLAGRTPTLEEARAFVEMPEAVRLQRTVDALLASKEYSRHFADGFAVVLLGREAQVDALNRQQFRDWLAARFDADAPLDAIAREILDAKTDDAVKEPAAQYLLLAQDPPTLAGRTARIFLGNRIQCAQCHDHPYEPWKRTDFWSLAAYFQRVHREPVYEPQTDEMRKKKIQQRVINWKLHENPNGDTYIPLQPGEVGRAQLALPRFLGGTYDLALHGTAAPRLPSLADAVTKEKRHELARAMANRFFAELFGRGIVHPVDDFSEARSPVIPSVLERITRGLEEGELRLKPFLRALALTKAYGRSAAGQPVASDDVEAKIDARDKEAWTKGHKVEDPALELFARMRHKPLSPEQAAHAVVTASRADEAAKLAGEGPWKQWKNQQEPDIERQYVNLMKRNEEEDPHSVQEAIPLALVFMNGPTVNFFCQARPGSTVGIAVKETDVRVRVEGLYMSAFTRLPTESELAAATLFFSKQKDVTKATEDYYWSLVNSSEFLYNH